MRTQLRGGGYSALSAILFGLIPVLCLSIYDNGGDPATITCIRALVAAVVYGFWLRKSGGTWRVTRQEGVCLLLTAVLGITATDLLLAMSYEYIPGGLATTLHFIYPVACVLVESLLFREKMSGSAKFSLILVMTGIILFSGQNLTFRPIGVAIALLSGLCYTFYLVMVARSPLRHMDSGKILFYISVVEALAAGGMAAGKGFPKMNAKAWGMAILLSLLVNVVAALLLQKGIREVGLTTASMLSTLEPFTSVVAGVLLCGDRFGLPEMAGCLMVCTGIVLIFRKKEAFEKET